MTTTHPSVRRPHRRGALLIVAGLAVAAAAGIMVAVAGDEDQSGPPAEEDVAFVPGAVGPMRGPIIDRVFPSSGRVTAGGVTVDGADVQLGWVPLNVTAAPTWTLTNTSAHRVLLGEPHPEVVTGCCPGPLILSATDLAPGASATLTFALQMHAGMDGAHDLRVHVPVEPSGSAQTAVVTLSVAGDFSGGDVPAHH